MDDEREAVSRLKQGDIGGLEILVMRYQVRAVRAAYLITRDARLSEDLVQAAFLRAYERIAQFDAGRPFGPWFLRSVVNDAIKASFRQKSQLSLDDPDSLETDTLPDSAPGPDAALEQAETRRAVWEALAKLPPSQRAAVVLRYYLDLPETEIAANLESPRGTVKWWLHEARERLRALLSPLRPSETRHEPGIGDKP